MKRIVWLCCFSIVLLTVGPAFAAETASEDLTWGEWLCLDGLWMRENLSDPSPEAIRMVDTEGFVWWNEGGSFQRSSRQLYQIESSRLKGGADITVLNLWTKEKLYIKGDKAYTQSGDVVPLPDWFPGKPDAEK